MSAQTTKQVSENHSQVQGLWRAAAINVAAAVAANLVALFILKAILPLPAEFPPLQFGPVAMFTFIGTALAGVAYAIVARLSRTPARTYWIVAMVALVLSILPNLGAMANPSSFPFPGGSALTFGVLIVFHVIAGLISAYTLTTLTRR